MKTYELEIRSISRELDYQGFQDVAKIVNYTLHAYNERKVYMSYRGQVLLPYPADKNNYIPYFELTKDQVESWTWNILKNSQEYDQIIEGLNADLDQAELSRELPWDLN